METEKEAPVSTSPKKDRRISVQFVPPVEEPKLTPEEKEEARQRLHFFQ